MAKRSNRRQSQTLTDQIRALMPEAVETVVTSVTAVEAVEEVEVGYNPLVEMVERQQPVTVVTAPIEAPTEAPTAAPTTAPTAAPTEAPTAAPAMPELPALTPPAELLTKAIAMAAPSAEVVEEMVTAATVDLPVVEEEEDMSLPLAVRLLRKKSLRERMLDKTSPPAQLDSPWWKPAWF